MSARGFKSPKHQGYEMQRTSNGKEVRNPYPYRSAAYDEFEYGQKRAQQGKALED